jgi:hypothetical protein
MIVDSKHPAVDWGGRRSHQCIRDKFNVDSSVE